VYFDTCIALKNQDNKNHRVRIEQSELKLLSYNFLFEMIPCPPILLWGAVILTILIVRTSNKFHSPWKT
jgi:hypothetical protein